MKSYSGGKGASGTYQQIINKIPPHNIYVAACAGHDSVFRKKRRASVSVLNDIDPGVIASWKRSQKTVMPDCLVYDNFMQGDLFEKPAKPVVILRNTDYRSIVKRFKNNPDAFIYLDPPYPLSVRSSQTQLYNFEWDSDDDHINMLNLIQDAKAMIMVSSYPNSMYDARLEGWTTHQFNSMTRGGIRTEQIWMNYSEPKILHDTQYVGKNFRDRHELKRKIQRWNDRLDKMEQHEKIAILSSIINTYKQETETLIRL